MTKTEMINEVAYEMREILTREQQDRLKITFLVKRCMITRLQN